MIPADLFQFAYIPSWYEQLYELSQLAAPEPWRFMQPMYETQNKETPILERYINQVFRKQAVDYSCAPEGQAGQIFYIKSRIRLLSYRAEHQGLQEHLHVLQPQQTFRFAEKMVLQRLYDRGLAMVQIRSAAAVAAHLRHAAVDDVLRPGMGNPRQRQPHP